MSTTWLLFHFSSLSAAKNYDVTNPGISLLL